MRLIVLGPPGAGQGTQAERLAAERGIPHVSTAGLPDEVTDQLVADRLAEPDAASGFLLEGYPRTMPQVRALEALLQGWGTPLDAVLQLVVDEDDERSDVDDRETALAEHYAAQGLLVRVDGEGATEEVADRLAAALEESVPARAADRATPGAPSGSRPPSRALRILFAALVCWPLVGLPLKVAVGEPYPSLFAPSFAIPVGADGKIPYSAYRLTAIRADGSALPVEVKRIFPNSRAAIGIVARRILQEDAAVQSPESKEWLRERLRVEYRLEDPRALVVHWLEREWDARTKSTSPADHVRPTRIDLDEPR